MKRKLLALLLVIAIACFSAFAFTACGGGEDPSNPPTSEEGLGGEGSGESGGNSGEGSGESGGNSGEGSGESGGNSGEGSGESGSNSGEGSGESGGNSGEGSGESGGNSGEGSGESGGNSGEGSGESGGNNEQPPLLNITGVSFTNTSFVYDGTEKTITISGTLPEGVTPAYTNNTRTDIGSHEARVVLSGEGYNPLTLTAYITITRATMSNISLDGARIVEYDTLGHRLQVIGNVPAGAQVSITYNGQPVQEVFEVGTYSVVATITHPNYDTLVLNDTLKITSKEEQLFSVNDNGTIYFQNNLDGNKLYSYKNGNLKKVSNDNAQYMIAANGVVYYMSNALVGDSIKTVNNSITSKLYSVSGEHLATDGTYIYYSVNGLLAKNEEKGIWKLALSGESEPVRLTSVKGEYLTYYDNTIYFSNKNDGGNLYKISTSANNGTPTLVWDERSEYIIQDSGVLYFNSGTLGKAIRKLTISSGTCVKLTTDSGSYLTKIGSYVYYVRNDLLTATLFGDNICKISALSTSDHSLPGTTVISATDNGFSSLTSDGEFLYYYKLNDKHFYSYDIEGETETDLMEDFIVDDSVTLKGFAKIAEYNGEVYFINNRDNNNLYKYNPTTRATFKVLDDSVSGVYFYNGYMYYSSYVLTNFALWKMDMSTFESVKISSDRCDNLIFDGETIYYIKTGSAYNNYIYSMGLDGSNPTKLFDTTLNVADFYKEGNYLYCMANAGLLGTNDKIYRYDLTSSTSHEYSFEAEAFTVYNGKIYYYEHNDNKLYCYDGTSSTLLASNVKINDLIVYNGYLYYSSVSSSNKGLFAINLSTTQSTKIHAQNADALTVINGTVYFVEMAVFYTNDYPNAESNGNSANLYAVQGNSVSKLN